MMHKKRIEWFKTIFNNKIDKYPDIRYISESESDLGALEGLEFNSNIKGGYIYFWSSCYIGFQIVDYVNGEEIVKDTLLEVSSEQSLDEVLSVFIKNI